MASYDIVVIGASAGGVEALRQVAHGLPLDFPAAVFAVLHSRGPSILPSILSNALPAVAAHDGDPIEFGKVYVARPDFHLIIDDSRMRVFHGPKENRHRPSIDVLFRSAASEYGSHVIGVILSGSMNDGSAGLAAIKNAGGVAVVQDPRDAPFPDMPQNALNAVKVDYCLPLKEIPALLTGLVNGKMRSNITPAKTMKGKTADPRTIGKPSVFTCPECHGTLWELQEGELVRFTCRVGHTFSIGSMEEEVSEATEAALWAAIRMLEEKAELSRRMASDARRRNQEAFAQSLENRALKSEHDAALIRKLIEETGREEASKMPAPFGDV